jgi:glycosyltransferase involved in cell wall biosynthesis
MVGLSPGIVEGIVRLGVARDRVAMIPNGCDLELFGSPVDPWRPPGVSETDLMAIFTGTHGPANGLGAIVDVAAELKRRGVEGIKLVLVGEGKEKAELVARCKAGGLEGVLIFHPPTPKLRLAGLMASADLGLQILANVPAFYYGTSPNKFFDYLAAGLPVLTNYPGWVADLVTENGAGFAVPPDDPATFADALEEARHLRDAGKLDRAAPRALAAARFSRERLAGEWMAFVTEGPTGEVVRDPDPLHAREAASAPPAGDLGALLRARDQPKRELVAGRRGARGLADETSPKRWGA